MLCVSSGDSSARALVQYATSSVPLELRNPVERKQLDVIRKEMGRLTKVRPWAKRKGNSLRILFSQKSAILCAFKV